MYDEGRQNMPTLMVAFFIGKEYRPLQHILLPGNNMCLGVKNVPQTLVPNVDDYRMCRGEKIWYARMFAAKNTDLLVTDCLVTFC